MGASESTQSSLEWQDKYNKLFDLFTKHKSVFVTLLRPLDNFLKRRRREGVDEKTQSVNQLLSAVESIHVVLRDYAKRPSSLNLMHLCDNFYVLHTFSRDVCTELKVEFSEEDFRVCRDVYRQIPPLVQGTPCLPDVDLVYGAGELSVLQIPAFGKTMAILTQVGSDAEATRAQALFKQERGAVHINEYMLAWDAWISLQNPQSHDCIVTLTNLFNEEKEWKRLGWMRYNADNAWPVMNIASAILSSQAMHRPDVYHVIWSECGLSAPGNRWTYAEFFLFCGVYAKQILIAVNQTTTENELDRALTDQRLSSLLAPVIQEEYIRGLLSVKQNIPMDESKTDRSELASRVKDTVDHFVGTSSSSPPQFGPKEMTQLVQNFARGRRTCPPKLAERMEQSLLQTHRRESINLQRALDQMLEYRRDKRLVVQSLRQIIESLTVLYSEVAALRIIGMTFSEKESCRFIVTDQDTRAVLLERCNEYFGAVADSSADNEKPYLFNMKRLRQDVIKRAGSVGMQPHPALGCTIL